MIGLDDWTVQTTRELAELQGPIPGTGPYVTVGIFTGPDAEARARSVVASMAPLIESTGVPVDELIWAWSGRDILADRKRRGLT